MISVKWISRSSAACSFGSRIVATDRETSRLVYELYGLTKVEIEIIEGVSG
jgi:hypothetical protein